AAEGRVTVSTEQREPRRTERLKVHLVADAVAGLGVVAAEAPGDRLEIAVVLGVPGIELVDLMIRVGDDGGRLDAVEPHRLELEPRHRAVRVGQEDLVHPEADLLSGEGLACDQVVAHELLDETLRHQVPRAGSGWKARAAGPT